jgi:hypothetical protein
LTGQGSNNQPEGGTMPPVIELPKITPVAVDAGLPKDPELRALAEDVLAQVKLALAVAAAETEAPATQGRYDAVCRSFLATRSPASRTVYRQRAAAALATPASRQGHFGRYANLDPVLVRGLGSDKLETKVGHLKLDPNKISAAIAAHNTKQKPVIKLNKDAVDLALGAKFKKLRLTLLNAHCIEETDEVGDDEISMGGTKVTPAGKSSVVQPFVVSNEFDSGETKSINRVFAEWDIDRGKDWPHVYTAVVCMAEKDDGGFYKFLKELWEIVDDKVKAAVAAGVGAAIGGSIGGVVGAAVGAIVGLLIGWIISWFDNPDDIVGARTVTMTLAAATKSYYDWAKLTTPGGWQFPEPLQFNGDGGRYRVNAKYTVAEH